MDRPPCAPTVPATTDSCDLEAAKIAIETWRELYRMRQDRMTTVENRAAAVASVAFTLVVVVAAAQAKAQGTGTDAALAFGFAALAVVTSFFARILPYRPRLRRQPASTRKHDAEKELADALLQDAGETAKQAVAVWKARNEDSHDVHLWRSRWTAASVVPLGFALVFAALVIARAFGHHH